MKSVKDVDKLLAVEDDEDVVVVIVVSV